MTLDDQAQIADYEKNGWMVMDYDGTEQFWKRAAALSFIRNDSKIIINVKSRFKKKALEDPLPVDIDIATMLVCINRKGFSQGIWYNWFKKIQYRGIDRPALIKKYRGI